MFSSFFRAASPPSTRPRVWIRGGVLATVLIGAAGLAPSSVLLAQSQTGMHLSYGAFLARPYLDAPSGEVFEHLGRFRPGLGVAAGIGYDAAAFGATLFSELAAVEIGPERQRDGIGIGREMGILSSYGLAAEWRAPWDVAMWRPVLSAGYLRQRVDNVLLTPSELPAYAQDSAAAPSSAPAGVAGWGVRVGASMERPLSGAGLPGQVILRVSASGDVVRVTRLSYGTQEWAIPRPGWAVTPRLTLSLRWNPTARSAIPKTPSP